MKDLLTLRDTIPGQRTLDHRQRLPIYLFDNFYFQHIAADLYRKAEGLARQISQISRGRKTRILSDNSEVVGKIGEYVVHSFLDHYYRNEFVSNVEAINPRGGDVTDFLLLPGEVRVDVKTRELHTDETIAPTFDLRVPYTETEKYQDVFVLAGYCPQTGYGYVFGWCTWDELQAKPVKTDIKFPAKCIPLLELHPMLELETYVEQRHHARKL